MRVMTTGERDPELLQQLGQLVREACKAAGLDQTKLAERARVSRGFVQQLWGGRRFDGKPFNPKPANLLAVANVLDLDRAHVLRLASINPEEYADQPMGRPATSVRHLAELAASLTPRQRDAVVEIIESILHPHRDEVAAASALPSAQPVYRVGTDEPDRGGSSSGGVFHVGHDEQPRRPRTKAAKPAGAEASQDPRGGD